MILLVFPVVGSQLFDLLLFFIFIAWLLFLTFHPNATPYKQRPTVSTGSTPQQCDWYSERCQYNYFYSHINSFWQADTLPFILWAPPNMCVWKSKRLLAKKDSNMVSKWIYLYSYVRSLKLLFTPFKWKLNLCLEWTISLKLLTAEADRTKRCIIGVQVRCGMLN